MLIWGGNESVCIKICDCENKTFFFNIFIFHFLNHILDLIPALYVDVLIFPPPLLFLYNSRINTAYANPHLFISPFLHVRIL